MPSTLAIALATAAPTLAQEDWDTRPWPPQSAQPEQAPELDEEPDVDPDDENWDEPEDDMADADPAVDDDLGERDADSSFATRENLAALVKLPVVDSEGKKFATVVNAVMSEDGPHRVIIKLDSIIGRDRLMRAVPSTQVAFSDEGDTVALATLTKADVRKQSPFLFEGGMDTVVPIDKPADRSDQQSES